MNMQQALRERLKDDAGVAAIAGTRIDWGINPQGSPLPRVRLQVISDPRPQHLKGFQGLRETRVQADCMADDAATATALAEAVIAAAVPAAEKEGVRFGRAGIEGPTDRGEQTDTGFVHRQSVDLMIWHGTI